MSIIRAVYIYKEEGYLDLDTEYNKAVKKIREIFSEDKVKFVRWYFIGTHESLLEKPELGYPYPIIVDVTFNDESITPFHNDKEIHDMVLNHIRRMINPVIHNTSTQEKQTYYDIQLKSV